MRKRIEHFTKTVFSPGRYKSADILSGFYLCMKILRCQNTS